MASILSYGLDRSDTREPRTAGPGLVGDDALMRSRQARARRRAPRALAPPPGPRCVAIRAGWSHALLGPRQRPAATVRFDASDSNVAAVALSLFAAIATVRSPPVPAAGRRPDRVDVRCAIAGRPIARRSGVADDATTARDLRASWPRPARDRPRAEAAPERVGTAPRPPTASTPTSWGTTAAHSPGDPTGATGPTRVVAAVNVRRRRLRPHRHAAARAAAAPLDEHQSRGSHETDPKVFYDAVRRHVRPDVPGLYSSQGYIEVVTIPSATAEDTGTWCMHPHGRRPGAQRQARVRRLPEHRVHANRVVVTTNNFGFNDGPFRYAQIISMPKSAAVRRPDVHEDRAHRGGSAAPRPGTPTARRRSPCRRRRPSAVRPTDQFLVSLEPKADVGEARAVASARRQRQRSSIAKIARPSSGSRCRPTGTSATARRTRTPGGTRATCG